jgi:hypothetical protein
VLATERDAVANDATVAAIDAFRSAYTSETTALPVSSLLSVVGDAVQAQVSGSSLNTVMNAVSAQCASLVIHGLEGFEDPDWQHDLDQLALLEAQVVAKVVVSRVVRGRGGSPPEAAAQAARAAQRFLQDWPSPLVQEKILNFTYDSVRFSLRSLG